MVFNMPVNYLILNAFPFLLFGRIILYKGEKYKKKKDLAAKWITGTMNRPLNIRKGVSSTLELLSE